MSPHPLPVPIEMLVDQYCLAWSSTDPLLRARLIAKTMSTLATYVDPGTQGELNVAELQDHIVRVQARRPGARVIRTSKVDHHHRFGRFLWCVELADGTRLPESIDFIETDSSGLLLRVTGFFGTLAAA